MRNWKADAEGIFKGLLNSISELRIVEIRYDFFQCSHAVFCFWWFTHPKDTPHLLFVVCIGDGPLLEQPVFPTFLCRADDLPVVYEDLSIGA